MRKNWITNKFEGFTNFLALLYNHIDLEHFKQWRWLCRRNGRGCFGRDNVWVERNESQLHCRYGVYLLQYQVVTYTKINSQIDTLLNLFEFICDIGTHDLVYVQI